MSSGKRYTEDQILKGLQEIEAAFVQPGSPWRNGHAESFFDKLRDELLHREIFSSGAELQAHLDGHLEFYNHSHPRRSLGGLAPASFKERTSSAMQEAEELKL
jgi:transposase InsO family protein